MKMNIYYALIASALVLTAGCKKSLNSQVNLSNGAKAGFVMNDDWQRPAVSGRVIRYDVGDGNGSDCLLAYDISTGQVSLTKVSGANSTTLYSGSGLSGLSVNTDYGDVIDNYTEIGGVHIIPYDAGGTGHEDHILMYIPSHGILYLLHFVTSTGQWAQDWSSTAGIAGYDLASKTDKIISYDYGSGYKNALIVYRPLVGYVWVIENTGTASSPVFTAVVKSSSGIGGFDFKGELDQLLAVGYNPGAMDLVAYRPGNNYLWYINHHTAYSTSFTTAYTSRSGFPNFSFADSSTRMIALNESGAASTTYDNTMYCYHPGAGGSYSVVDVVSGSTVSGGAPYPYLYYPFANDPYAPGANYVGDHALAFSGNGLGNSSLLFYANGSTSTQSQIYELNTSTSTYTQVY